MSKSLTSKSHKTEVNTFLLQNATELTLRSDQWNVATQIALQVLIFLDKIHDYCYKWLAIPPQDQA